MSVQSAADRPRDLARTAVPSHLWGTAEPERVEVQVLPWEGLIVRASR